MEDNNNVRNQLKQELGEAEKIPKELTIRGGEKCISNKVEGMRNQLYQNITELNIFEENKSPTSVIITQEDKIKKINCEKKKVDGKEAVMSPEIVVGENGNVVERKLDQ
jgi:GTP-binding protein EngB required for normal cell division